MLFFIASDGIVLFYHTRENKMGIASQYKVDRRSFIGGSDARVIMGGDEALLIRLWREGGGGGGPEGLSDKLIGQPGPGPEGPHRRLDETNTGQPAQRPHARRPPPRTQ